MKEFNMSLTLGWLFLGFPTVLGVLGFCLRLLRESAAGKDELYEMLKTPGWLSSVVGIFLGIFLFFVFWGVHSFLFPMPFFPPSGACS